MTALLLDMSGHNSLVWNQSHFHFRRTHEGSYLSAIRKSQQDLKGNSVVFLIFYWNLNILNVAWGFYVSVQWTGRPTRTRSYNDYSSTLSPRL